MQNKTYRKLAALFAATAIAAGASAGTVDIEWQNPDDYTDLGTQPYDNTNVETFKEEITEYLDRQAQEYLPDGAVLSMTITDVNLAGEMEPWNIADDVRIVRDIYPPKMRFSYKLVRNGETLEQGSASITDLDFNYNIGRRFADSDQFFYEKEMLNEWIREEF